jgi:taurine dioxygenase
MTESYKHIAVENLTPKLAGEVTGVNLASLNDALIEEIKAAFLERQVLIFRNQELTREQHKEFGRRFGKLQTHPAKTNLGAPGDPEIFDITISAKTKVANGEAWHTDLSCEPIPPMASALYIKEVPESGGGDTLFASMTEAYSTLSEPIQVLLQGLTAFHNGYKDLRAYGYTPKPGDNYPTATHPVIIKHPETGRPVLFVNEPFTEKIIELSQRESDAILDMLYRHIETNTRFHCRVKWEVNTLVLWDNRAVHHHAVWDYYPESRSGERVTIKCPTAHVAWQDE